MLRRIQYFGSIVSNMGVLSEMIAPFTLLALIPVFVFGEWDLLIPLLTLPVTFIVLGLLFSRIKRERRYCRVSVSLCTIAFFWLTAGLICGLPYLFSGTLDISHAFFEGMAGWTGTSFSFLNDTENQSLSLVFWRAYSQWLGSIGIIALSLAIVRGAGISPGYNDLPEIQPEDLIHSIANIARDIWVVYACISIVAALLIYCSGIPVKDTILLTFSSVSAGGYCPLPGGIMAYHSGVLEAALIVIMILAALPFPIYLRAWRRRKTGILSDEQIPLLMAIGGISVLILTLDLVFFSHMGWMESFRYATFTATSALTTTGFTNAHTDIWTPAGTFLLLFLTFSGGAALSASGGIKLRRIAFAYKGLVWWSWQIFATKRMLMPFIFEGKRFSQKEADIEVSKNMMVIVFSLGVIIAAFLVSVHLEPYIPIVLPVLYDTVSAFSTCGISMGYFSPVMPDGAVWNWIILMWIGRIEVIPAILLIKGIFFGPD